MRLESLEGVPGDGVALGEEGASGGDHDEEESGGESDLSERIGKFGVALEESESVEPLHEERDEEHRRSDDGAPGDGDEGDGFAGSGSRVGDGPSVVVLDGKAVLELSLSHERNVDAVGGESGGERDETGGKTAGLVSEGMLESERDDEGGGGGGYVGGAELLGGERRGGVAVGVVDEGVEGLIGPLPEDDGGRGSIEEEHGADQSCPARHLEGHPTHGVLQLPTVRVEGRLHQRLSRAHLPHTRG